MESDFFLFTSFYALISFGLVIPPAEFVSAGLTVECLFQKWLGSEIEQFVQYHIRRSNATILCHSCLLLGYFLGLSLVVRNPVVVFFEGGILWKYFLVLSLVFPLCAVLLILLWWKSNWKYHPIVRRLSVYCTPTTDWRNVASSINDEFRRIEKLSLQTSTITKVIATHNWILKVMPYSMECAYQSDSVLIVTSSETHNLSATTGAAGVQFVTIEVKNVRSGSKSFKIRVNSLDFTDLQNRIIRPIRILENVVFHRSLVERFIDAFDHEIKRNPKHLITEDVELCIGCMNNRANVKLVKLCESDTSSNSCTHCYCRPMWCVQCMAKWFASRQDQDRPDTWLESKCTCPMCRAKFCILDVCILDQG